MHIYPTLPSTEFYTPERCHIIEVFNTVQHPEVSIAQARVEAGVTTVKHRVRGTAELYYILSGRGEMFFNAISIGLVQPGDVVYIPADTPQYIHNTGEEELVFLCVCVPGFRQEAYEHLADS